MSKTGTFTIVNFASSGGSISLQGFGVLNLNNITIALDDSRPTGGPIDRDSTIAALHATSSDFNNITNVCHGCPPARPTLDITYHGSSDPQVVWVDSLVPHAAVAPLLLISHQLEAIGDSTGAIRNVVEKDVGAELLEETQHIRVLLTEAVHLLRQLGGARQTEPPGIGEDGHGNPVAVLPDKSARKGTG